MPRNQESPFFHLFPENVHFQNTRLMMERIYLTDILVGSEKLSLQCEVVVWKRVVHENRSISGLPFGNGSAKKHPLERKFSEYIVIMRELDQSPSLRNSIKGRENTHMKLHTSILTYTIQNRKEPFSVLS